MAQGQQIRGKFVWKTGEDRQKTVDSIKNKVSSGHYFSNRVFRDIAEKIAPQFAEIMGD